MGDGQAASGRVDRWPSPVLLAAVIHAFALRRLSRFQIAALSNLMAAEQDDDVFIQLIEHTLAARRLRAAA